MVASPDFKRKLFVFKMRERFRAMLRSHLEANLAACNQSVVECDEEEENWKNLLDQVANEEEHNVLTETSKLISYRTAVLRKVIRNYRKKIDFFLI